MKQLNDKQVEKCKKLLHELNRFENEWSKLSYKIFGIKDFILSEETKNERLNIDEVISKIKNEISKNLIHKK